MDVQYGSPESVVEALEDVAAVFGLRSFELWHTGGGCWAYESVVLSDLADGRYVMVTGEDVLYDGSLADFGSGVTVGLYDGATGDLVGDTVFIPFGESVSLGRLCVIVSAGLSRVGVPLAECVVFEGF